MPCDGVAVVRTKLKGERDYVVREIAQKIAELGIEIPEGMDLARAININLPAGDLGIFKAPPTRLSIDLAGNVTAITTAGTFQEGKQLLSWVIAYLQNNGILVEAPIFESHRHEQSALTQQYSQYHGQGLG